MGRSIPEILSQEEQDKLINQFNLRYPTQHRNKMMIGLILNTGLRRAETINLRWKDINFTREKLKVVDGKGAKDRIIWIPEKTINNLEEWKERQTKELKKRGVREWELVFTTLKGKRVNPDNFYMMVRNYAEKAGINKKVGPNTLRHTFATDLYRETKDLKIVQKALGHDNISATQIYTHILDKELENAMKNFRNQRV